jgi:hypothetical protein
LALSIPALVACASTPPRMTDAERYAMASETIPSDRVRAVETVTDFLLAEGYSIERFDDGSGVLMTGWRDEAYTDMAQRVQVRFRSATGTSETHVDFLIFNRFKDVDESVNLYPARYRDLMGRFRAFVKPGATPSNS